MTPRTAQRRTAVCDGQSHTTTARADGLIGTGFRKGAAREAGAGPGA